MPSANDKRYVIFDGEEILGRVHTRTGPQMAELMAKTFFPDAQNLRLTVWANASKKQRKEAQAKACVRPEMCTRLWSNPERPR